MNRAPRRWTPARLALMAALALLVLLAAGALAIWREIDAPADQGAVPPAADPQQIARGAYLAKIGNCQGCHTRPDGAPYAGGRPISTPFGTIHSSNLTPDPATGIGSWSSAAFRRALRDGRSRDGQMLYPAFPYPHTTHLADADIDALHAHLRNVAAVAQTNQSHQLRFPYDTRVALAVWRLLYFRPGGGVAGADQAGRSADWQRGAYLVRSLGHCGACHVQRDLLGGADARHLDGGLMAGASWYAPSLASDAGAGVGDWPVEHIVALLTTGMSPRGIAQGPMADFVRTSSQYLDPADARAIAVYLRSISRPASPPDPEAVARLPPPDPRGAEIYRRRCADCHAEDGRGVPGAYPALAGNRLLQLDPPVNLIQVIVHGGFAPVTAGNPRPFGMPPYGLELDNEQLAALMSFLRRAWGGTGSPIPAAEVQRWREERPR